MTALQAKHILVVDDNPGDIGLIHQALDGTGAVVLHVVMNIVQANAFLVRRSPFESAPMPDLVLLDLRLPIFPGINLLSVIKNDERFRHIKVVIFTSSARDSDKQRCRELGADDYVVKPRDWPEWKSTIAAVLTKYCGILPDGSAWSH